MNYLLGTDIGTSGTKTILMDLEGNLISQDLQEYDVLTPRPLWAEQHADVWIKAGMKSIKNTVLKSGVTSSQIKAISISGLFGGSGVPVDFNRNPVRPCIIWMDRRSIKQQKWVEKNIGLEKLSEITHNCADPYYGFLKMLWIKDNEPENWNKITQFMAPNSYLIEKLTGIITIDHSSAGDIGGIYDMNTRGWSHEMMDAMKIPRSMVPEKIIDSTDLVGYLRREVAEELGLSTDTKVFSGGIDSAAATFGMGVTSSGGYTVTIGTSMCACLVHDNQKSNDLLINYPYVYNSKELNYSLGGAATAGGIIKWFKDTFAELEKENENSGGINTYQKLDSEAEKIPPGSNGLLVLPYFMGERSPIWDTNARGIIYGLSLSHGKADIYRAFLEAVSYALRNTMEVSGVMPREEILVAGGASKSKLWLQIIADITGCKVISPTLDVEANLGDVMIAGLGSGLLTLEDIKNWNHFSNPVVPNPSNKKIYDKYYEMYLELYQNNKGFMAKMSELN